MGAPPKQLPKHRALAGTVLTSFGIQLLTVVSGVLVARLLQPDGRGVLAAVQLWPGILASIAWLGANYSFAVRAARTPDEVPALARAGAALTIVSSGVFVLLGWFLLPYLLPAGRPDILQLSRWYLIFIPVNVLLAYLQALDQGAGRLRPFNTTRHFLSLTYLVVVLVWWFLGIQQVEWFMGALLGANLLTLLLRMHLTGWRSIIPDFNRRRLRGVLREGAPFLASSAVYLAKENIERLVLLFLLGSQQLGLYVVAATASGLHTTVARSVNMLILARSGSLAAEHAAADNARIFRVMLLVSFFLSVAMLGVLPWLIPLAFGSEFRDSVWPALLLILAQLFATQGAILDEGLRAQSRPGVGLLASVVSVLLFLVLGMMAAPRFGLVGVAAAAVAGQCAYCLLLCAYLISRFRVLLFPNASDFQFIRHSFGVAINRMLASSVA